MLAFTLNFLKIFMVGVTYAFPILLFLLAIVVLLGRLAGKRQGLDWFDSIYWTFITAITVGYGDIAPTNRFSKCCAIGIGFTGVIFTGILVALASHATTFSLREQTKLAERFKNSVAPPAKIEGILPK